MLFSQFTNVHVDFSYKQGNGTLQNQSLVESLSQNSTQTFFINESKSNESLAQLQSGPQLHLPAQQLQSSINASQLHQDEASKESPNTSPPASLLPSSFHLSGEEVKSEHKLHVDNTDASSEMQGNLNTNGASVTLSGPGTMDLTSTGTSFTQDVTVDSDGDAQTPWTCCQKVPPPKDCKPCPKLPKAPPSELDNNRISRVFLLSFVNLAARVQSSLDFLCGTLHL